MVPRHRLAVDWSHHPLTTVGSHCDKTASRGVMSLDNPDAQASTTAPLALPSADLLDRARIGWERFLSTLSAVADE